MTNPPPRKRFPLPLVRGHLSTAIVMMFVAGGIIWANIRVQRLGMGSGCTETVDKDGTGTETWHKNVSEAEYWASTKYLNWNGQRVDDYGFPIAAVRFSNDCNLYERDDSRTYLFTHNAPILNVGAIVINTLSAIAVLFAVWFLCEWLIRRRAARKGA